jgi:RNA-binding protein YlmH
MIGWLGRWWTSIMRTKAVVRAGDVIVIRGGRFRVLGAETTKRGKLLKVESEE